jgi:hypothetical protein
MLLLLLLLPFADGLVGWPVCSLAGYRTVPASIIIAHGVSFRCSTSDAEHIIQCLLCLLQCNHTSIKLNM